MTIEQMGPIGPIFPVLVSILRNGTDRSHVRVIAIAAFGELLDAGQTMIVDEHGDNPDLLL